jgi:hypothetical protein
MEVKKTKNMALTVLLMNHQQKKQKRQNLIIENLIEIKQRRKRRVSNQKMSRRSTLLRI